MIRRIFNQTTLLIFVLFASLYAVATPSTITLQAKILKPDGTALEASSVNFTFTTLSGTGTCILYVEQFNNVNLTASGGVVVVNLGSSGSPTYTGGTTAFSSVFDNSNSLNCQGGGTYVPVTTDRRRLVIQFNDGTGAQTLPPLTINSVPYSQFAGSTDSLSGKTVSDFVLKTAISDCATAGKVLTFNGTAFSCVSPSTGGGTVTNVTSANSYLSVLNGTSTPTLTVNVGTVANTLAAGDDSRIVGAAQKANNLSDLASASTARTNLGLGTAAVLNAGTSANNLVQLDGSAKIPSALLPTNVVSTATALVGDVTGTIGATVVSTVGTATAAQVSQSVTDTLAATDLNTVSTIVKRDASGNIAVGNLAATNVSSNNNSIQNLYLYDSTNTNRILVKAPTSGITNHTLILPATQGAASSVLTNDGSGNLSWAAPAATGVTSVTSANTDIGVANSSTTPVLTLNSGTSANQILKLDGTAKIPAVDGSQVTNLDPTKLSAAVAINKGGTGATTATAAINNLLPTQTSNSGKVLQTDGTNVSWASASGGTVTSVTGTAPISIATGTSTPVVSIANGTAAGQTLRWDGTSAWAKTKLQYTDLVNNVSASPWPASSCTAGQAITWSSASDTFSCTTISLSASNFSSQTANTILAAPNGSAGTPTFRTLVSADLPAGIATQWTTTGSDIYYNTGKVGIGTTSPIGPLDVNSSSTVISNGTGANFYLHNTQSANGDYMAMGWLAEDTWGIFSADSVTHKNLVLQPYGGNVGLGTSVPASTLDIRGSASGYTDWGIVTIGDKAANQNGLAIGFDTTNNWSWIYSRAVGIASRPIVFNYDALYVGSSGAGGKVGIGTTSPTEKLTVTGGDANINGAIIGRGQGSFASNTVVGSGAMTLNTSGQGNTAMGNSAMWSNTTGGGNTAIGNSALLLNTTGTYNTVIGAGAGSSITTGSYNIAIGYNAQVPVATDSYQISIGNLIYSVSNNVGIGTTSPNTKLDVVGVTNSSGGYTQTSDIRLKTNVDYIRSDEALRKIASLRGIYYDWKDQSKYGTEHQIGLIAQDVQKVFPEAVKQNQEGLLSVSYSNLVAPVIEAVKELFKTSEKQSREIASIQAENEKLKKENAEIKARLDQIEKALKSK